MIVAIAIAIFVMVQPEQDTAKQNTRWEDSLSPSLAWKLEWEEVEAPAPVVMYCSYCGEKPAEEMDLCEGCALHLNVPKDAINRSGWY
jgi:hypothetical protein